MLVQVIVFLVDYFRTPLLSHLLGVFVNSFNRKPFGVPADPASITPVRMKYSVFRTIHLAFSLRMRMEMERQRGMEMEMEIFGALEANLDVIFGAPKVS